MRYNTRVVRALPLRTSPVSMNGSSHAIGATNGHAIGSAAADEGPALPWPRWEVTTEPSSQQARPLWPLRQRCKLAVQAPLACAIEESFPWEGGMCVIIIPAAQGEASISSHTVDAVVVCNGHYSVPRRPALPGADRFPGRVLHSHSYRENATYAGLTVIVIGASASGEDISREIALVADKVNSGPHLQNALVRRDSAPAPCSRWKSCAGSQVTSMHHDCQAPRACHVQTSVFARCNEADVAPYTMHAQVYLCARSWQNPGWARNAAPVGARRNVWRRPLPAELHADGGVSFAGGERVNNVDVVLYATGYAYTFPFLEEAGVVTVEDNRRALCLLLTSALRQTWRW